MGDRRSTVRRAFTPHPLMPPEESHFGKNSSVVVSICRRHARSQSRGTRLSTRWAHGRATQARGKASYLRIQRGYARIRPREPAIRASHACRWTRETRIQAGCVRGWTRSLAIRTGCACGWTRCGHGCDGYAGSWLPRPPYAATRRRGRRRGRGSHAGDAERASTGVTTRGQGVVRSLALRAWRRARRRQGRYRAVARRRRCFTGRSPLASLTPSARGAAGAGLLREAQGRKAKRTC